MVSIIIPTLNEESVIETTLQNLTRLTSVEHEVIVSDGHSRDRTIEIAKRYADKVITYSGKKRQTIAQARNMGAQQSRGEYFLFLDADVTVPDPNVFFQKTVSFFTDDPKLVALTVRIRVLPDRETLGDRLGFGYLNLLHVVMNNIFHRGVAAGECQMVRASAFRAVCGYREEMVVAEDYDLFTRLSKVGRTHMARDLFIFHTGRRAHKLGWVKVLWSWFMNSVMWFLPKHYMRKEWEEIR